MPSQTNRLDVVLVERGLAETRSRAQALVLAGSILIDGQVASRAGQQVSPDQDISISQGPPFVSRGGEKLKHALDAFRIDVTGRVCADIGASTGGFTDCLLQAGAARVYAIDVGYGQLDYSLRQDPRVVVLERVNARYLTELTEPVSLVSIDVSFISLRLIFPVLGLLLEDTGEVIALVKPQFEAGREQVGKKGVVSNPDVHRTVLANVVQYAEEEQFSVAGLVKSPLTGPAGNVEFLLHLLKSPASGEPLDIGELIRVTVEGG